MRDFDRYKCVSANHEAVYFSVFLTWINCNVYQAKKRIAML